MTTPLTASEMNLLRGIVACFHQRRMPDAFLVVTPFAATTGHAMVTGICQRCAKRDDTTLRTTAIRNLRAIYPDATWGDLGQA
jgi:hypothetical protein